MSDPNQPVPATSTDLGAVADAIGSALPVVETVLSILVPGSGPAMSAAIAIAKGVVAGVPEAEALYAQFKSGTPPSAAQLFAYIAQEQSAYDQVMADIQAKLKAA